MTGTLSALHPQWSVPGGRVDLHGAALPVDRGGPPRVRVGEQAARVVSASPQGVRIMVPADGPGGLLSVRIEPDVTLADALLVARPVATGLHQVDNPAFDGLGRLYVTQSGSRGVKVPVPIYRVRADGGREPVAVDLANPTCLVLGPDGAMFVSSRFEGHVYRLTADDQVELFAADLGVATGLAFDRHGSLYVGDRSGTIFKVTRDRVVETFASLPASVAAFHLAFGPDDCLYVSAPTLASHDAVYRITPDRLVDVYCDGFGRPQGLAFDSRGDLYIADALAGASGLYRIAAGQASPTAELVVASPTLIGVAFDPEGGILLASNDTVWRLDVPLTPLVLRG